MAETKKTTTKKAPASKAAAAISKAAKTTKAAKAQAEPVVKAAAVIANADPSFTVPAGYVAPETGEKVISNLKCDIPTYLL